MTPTHIDPTLLHELLYQSLESELCGINVYECAIRCATDFSLKRQWTGYLEDTLHHREVLLHVFAELGLDPNTQTPGRRMVAGIGCALVAAVQTALAEGDQAAAQRIAGECVCLIETKDQLNWELIGLYARHNSGPYGKVLRRACEDVGSDETLHLQRSRRWTRELWLAALGLPANLPPTDETKRPQFHGPDGASAM